MTVSFLRVGLSSLVVLGGGAALGCSGAGGAERFADGTGTSNASVTPAYGATTSGPTQAGSSTTPSSTTPGATTPGSSTPGAATSETNPTPTLVGSNPATGSNGDGSDLGSATMGGSGNSTNRYEKADVTRDGKNYYFMANGWGPGFVSQNVTWNGTSFTVSMQGMQGPKYEPASYPTMFCGAYSDSRSKECGLPATLDSMTALRTGWSWDANGNDGQYNAAYDIWLGNTTDRSSFSGYLMVWYREPVGQQPAGQRTLTGVTVQNVSGTWDIWTGQVGGRPIINWVRAEGQDTHDMEFDILDFVRDARSRNLTVPGSSVLSVAVGFEMWQPVTSLESKDFYVDVQ